MARQISEEVTVITQFHLSPKRRTGERVAHLVVLSGHNVGQVYNLHQAESRIGRDENADIQIMDAGISRRHALIVRTEDGIYEIRDAGSRNGTFANNHRVEEARTLEDGDKIQLGSMTVLRFAYTDEAEADYAQEMYEKAHRDGLTGVFNRRYFEDRLAAELAHAIRHNRHLALLMMDLDHFKAVNDAHGHPVGDTVLKEFAALLNKTTRGEDAVVRYGGEEFAVICRNTDLMKASILGERIRHEVSAAVFAADGPRLRITVSVGIAAAPDPEIRDLDTMVQAADDALYKAKQSGRNCVITRRKR
jgi:diguanylate cyclase (GGDEF)-like protein